MSQWPQNLNLAEIQESFREVWARLQSWHTGNPDLGGRKFTNVGDALSGREWLTLSQGDARYEPKTTQVPATTRRTKAVRIDTFANRGPADIWAYTLFEASDQNYVGWASNGSAWIYAYGYNQRTQAQLAALAALLGTNDANYLVSVTNFTHILRWTGTAWEYGPGELGSFYFQDFPGTPLGGTWGLCDGSTYTYLKADGTTGSYVSKNLTGHYRKSVTAAADATAAAIAPGLSGSSAAVSAGTPAGTVSQPSLTMDSYTPAGAVSQPTFTGNAVAAASTNATPDLVSPDTTGTGVSPVTTAAGTVSQPTFTGTASILTGTVSQPSFTGIALATHTHGVGTYAVDATGEPAAFKVLTYFRR